MRDVKHTFIDDYDERIDFIGFSFFQIIRLALCIIIYKSFIFRSGNPIFKKNRF